MHMHQRAHDTSASTFIANQVLQLAQQPLNLLLQNKLTLTLLLLTSTITQLDWWHCRDPDSFIQCINECGVDEWCPPVCASYHC